MKPEDDGDTAITMDEESSTPDLFLQLVSMARNMKEPMICSLVQQNYNRDQVTENYLTSLFYSGHNCIKS